MATSLDVTQFTAKERRAARKDLLKKIEDYNKQMKRTRKPSFPLSNPSNDLVYKGVLKITYDRGYVLQTKSVLTESNSTVEEVIDQLIDALGLTGSCDDYVLEERNLITNEIRPMKKTELPLKLHLQYGVDSPCLDIRLVQVRDSRVHMHRGEGAGESYSDEEDDEEDITTGTPPSLVPKDEVTDHGTANVELVMEEAVQDIPPLLHDIQERLRLLSDTVAVDGKARSDLPSRRALWDTLKPQASALVKDIRHLVDNGEFLVTRHCPSPECRLVVTVLLELITDYSRELIQVTKELCGLKGAAKTDLNSSVANFIQQITHISRLVNKTTDSLHAAALAGHLLKVTAPEKLLKTALEEDSYFSGSGTISAVLIFAVVTAYLGLVRAAYDDKIDYYAALANNMLTSTRNALETTQKTNEYALLHLHPLRSRVTDMEHKLKVAMDNLVRRVKLASSKRPSPDSSPEMLLAGHCLIQSALDFLMVAQCASLLHKVTITGWELMQLPWVRGWLSSADGNTSGTEESAHPASMYTTEQFSSIASTTSDSTENTSSVTSSSHKHSRAEKERKSRILTHARERGDGMDADQLAKAENGMSFGKLGMRASNLQLYYAGATESGEDADDEGMGRSSVEQSTPALIPVQRAPSTGSGTKSGTTESRRSNSRAASKKDGPRLLEYDPAKYTGIDAVQKLREYHVLNKAIAKVAEGLLLTLTQKINQLSMACQEESREKYAQIVELIVGATKQIRVEASAMEVELLGEQGIAESLNSSQNTIDMAIRDTYLALNSASAAHAGDKDRMRMIAAVTHLSNLSKKTVGDALSAVAQHRRALEQAEKLEQEFVALMTGRSPRKTDSSQGSDSPSRARRKITNTAKLSSAGESDAESVIFENVPPAAPFSPSGGKGWSAKATPKIIGGTLDQLIHRVAYHRVLDTEFVETFMLSFHRFTTAAHLLEALVERFHMKSDKTLTPWEMEVFQSDVLVPVRLRVVHALRLWMFYHPDDFKGGDTKSQSLQAFMATLERVMPVGAKQLKALLKEDEAAIVLLGRARAVKANAPQPIKPLIDESGSFELMDINTLELARQLTVLYSNTMRTVKLKELLTMGWEDSSRAQLASNIIKMTQLSRNLSAVVSRRVLCESTEDDQASVVSYFIKTAENCLDLKNYESVSAVVNGLTNINVQQATGAWQMLTESQMQAFMSLRDTVSPNMNYHKYRLELRNVHITPCIPCLSVVLKDLSLVEKDNSDHLPSKSGVLNFQKWRQLARIVQDFHQHQQSLYNLEPLEAVQSYLNTLTSTDDNEQST